jgi:outer membrane protein OmpA-like peptidoglycan-associated protein
MVISSLPLVFGAISRVLLREGRGATTAAFSSPATAFSSAGKDNKSNIRPQGAAVLDKAAETLKSHPNAVGRRQWLLRRSVRSVTLRLSERRSNAVVRYLAEHGVAEGRMSPHGYGKTNFVATNRTAEGRA